MDLEQVYMRPEMNSNLFEISLRGRISLQCKITSLSAFTWPQAKWNSFRGSSIYDVHKKWPIFRSPYPHHLQKWTIDLLFENNRIRKHVTNFKTPPPTFRVDVINVWSLGANFTSVKLTEVKFQTAVSFPCKQ